MKRWIVGPVALLMLLSLAGCGMKNHQPAGVQTDLPQEQSLRTFVGIVTMQDKEKSTVWVRELDSEVESVLHYDATSAVTDKYGEEITADHIQPGQILEVSYHPSDAVLQSASVPKDVWEYTEVTNYSFREEENMMKFAGKKYQYSNLTFVTDLVSRITKEELHPQDELTVRGLGIRVYSISQTSGHGYIRLTNYPDFLGGMVSVGNRIILPITDTMVITVREGEYPVTLKRGLLTTSKTVSVPSGQEVIVDFSDYVPVRENISLVTFTIAPGGADLYLNGTQVDYREPVALNYGEYKVRVEMTGYQTYSGVLDVEEEQNTIYIDLEEATATVKNGDDEASPQSTLSPDDSEETDEEQEDSQQKQVDRSHTISVTAPEGVEVYLDNVYKGIAPCKFKKVIGSQTITLSKSGYVTKSYQVDILDDDENATFSFSELPEDSD